MNKEVHLVNRKVHTVAVDLDGTILKYEGFKGQYHWGEPIEGAREFLKNLGVYYRVIIHTARDVNNEGIAESLRKHLEKHRLPYDAMWKGNGKPKASAYVDDRGISCIPQEKGKFEFKRALSEIHLLVNRKKLQKEKEEKVMVSCAETHRILHDLIE